MHLVIPTTVEIHVERKNKIGTFPLNGHLALLRFLRIWLFSHILPLMPQDDNVIPLKIKFCFYYKDVLKQTIVTIFKKNLKL